MNLPNLPPSKEEQSPEVNIHTAAKLVSMVELVDGCYLLQQHLHPGTAGEGRGQGVRGQRPGFRKPGGIRAPFVAGQRLGQLGLVYLQPLQPGPELLDAGGVDGQVLVDLEGTQKGPEGWVSRAQRSGTGVNGSATRPNITLTARYPQAGAGWPVMRLTAFSVWLFSAGLGSPEGQRLLKGRRHGGRQDTRTCERSKRTLRNSQQADPVF